MLSLTILTQNFKNSYIIFFKKHSINTYTPIRMNTHSYEHTYVHTTFMNISKRPNQFDLKIHETSHPERLIVDMNVTYH
jgi:hypothetical protein